jgi:hypothetical protein
MNTAAPVGYCRIVECTECRRRCNNVGIVVTSKIAANGEVAELRQRFDDSRINGSIVTG